MTPENSSALLETDDPISTTPMPAEPAAEPVEVESPQTRAARTRTKGGFEHMDKARHKALCAWGGRKGGLNRPTRSRNALSRSKAPRVAPRPTTAEAAELRRLDALAADLRCPENE